MTMIRLLPAMLFLLASWGCTVNRIFVQPSGANATINVQIEREITAKINTDVEVSVANKGQQEETNHKGDK